MDFGSKPQHQETAVDVLNKILHEVTEIRQYIKKMEEDVEYMKRDLDKMEKR